MGLLDRWRSLPESEVAQKEPRGGSGRGHTMGFLAYEEANKDLIGRSGLDMYDRMFRTDGDVRQIVNMAGNPIISGTWTVQPQDGEDATDQDQHVADVVTWMLFEAMSPNLIGHLGEMLPVLIRSGFTPFEEVWMSAEYTDGTTYLCPKTLGMRLPRSVNRWYQSPEGELTGIQQFIFRTTSDLPAMTDGASTITEGAPAVVPPMDQYGGPTGGARIGYVDLPITQLIYYRVGAEGDNWEGVSMLRPAYKHWKLKDLIERIDAIAQEREAVGIPIVYPPAGATDEQLDAAETILSGLRANEQGYIVSPGPFAGDVKDAASGWRWEILSHQGKGRDPMPSLEYHTQKIAAAFITEFMQLGKKGAGGSRNTAQIQQNPFLASVEALAGLVENVLNDQLVSKIVALNFPDVKKPPKLKMSLVDATSMTQLADFVSKLIMVGALIPDAELEGWLRERAELPPQEASVAKDVDQQTRYDIIQGQAQGGFGNSMPGSDTPPSSSKPGESDPRSQENNPGGGKGKSESPSRQHARAERTGYGFEADMDVAGINDTIDSMRGRMHELARPHIVAMAREAAQTGKRPKVPKQLSDDMYSCAQDMHDYGRATVKHEIRRQVQRLSPAGVIPESGLQDPLTLDRPANARDLRPHARNLAAHIADAVHRGASQGQMVSEHPSRVQRAAEQAGVAATQGMSNVYTMAAFNSGRILEGSSTPSVIGARYTAVLDRNTCDPCRESDDGQLRPLDDPWLVDHMPPNPMCASTASGHNMCRCTLKYEVMPPEGG